MPAFESSAASQSIQAFERRAILARWGKRGAGLLLCAAIVFGTFRLYGGWRKRHLSRQTDQFVQRGDFKNAVLVARRLLSLDPNDLAAARAMATMAEQSGSVDAIEWRKRIAQLQSGVAEDQIAFARTALRFGQLDLAEAVLNSLPPASRETLQFHQIAGALALAERDVASAETHFTAALKLSPEDPHLALNLATVRLTSVDPRVVVDCRVSLQRLAAKPAVRSEALRALAAHALAQGDRPNGLKWAEQLRSVETATFADALLYFQAAQQTDAAGPALETLKSKAVGSVETTAELITWLNRHEMARAAAEWSTLLPKFLVESQPVPLAIAESYSFLQDWETLRNWVAGKNWGEFEYLRLAVESHALRRLNPPGRPSREAETAWQAALKIARPHPEKLHGIARLAHGWSYEPEAEEAWWLMANSRDGAQVGLSALQRFYKTKRDARGLLRVARRALELNPKDLVAANNCASLGLLLNGDSTARRLAARLHAEHPTNRAFATTHAYALHTEGKQAEGLRVIETLKEEELRHPAIAAYYVIMLVDNGKLERARSFLVNAERATLLPEEQQLFAVAARKLEIAGTSLLKLEGLARPIAAAP